MSDKLFFDSIRYGAFLFNTIRYRYDMGLFYLIRYRYDMLASKKTFFLRNFRRIFGVVVVVVEDFGSWVFGIFGEFSEFPAKKDKKITDFESIEVLDIGGSI